MTVIASIDGVNRDIYLHADTVNNPVHPIDIYKEMRTLRRTDETLRNFDVFLAAKGNDPKGSGKFTERYVICKNGTRIIPYDTSHELTVTGTIITDDGQEGIACFDRNPLTASTIVDVNYVPPQVEVITVSSGSGLDAAQDAKLTAVNSLITELHRRMDMDAANPNTYSDDASNLLNALFELTKTDNGNGTFTVQRS
mgnify:CR=1 FL=1